MVEGVADLSRHGPRGATAFVTRRERPLRQHSETPIWGAPLTLPRWEPLCRGRQGRSTDTSPSLAGTMSNMRAEQLLRRLMVAATLMVAALIFAPAGAYAHGGHHHDIQPIEQVAKPVAKHSAETQLIKIAPLAVEDGASMTGRSVEVHSGVLPASTSRACGSCAGGCCHSAGTGCCAAFITAVVQIGIPSPGRSELNFVDIRGAGITPDALPEPPKSLV